MSSSSSGHHLLNAVSCDVTQARAGASRSGMSTVEQGGWQGRPSVGLLAVSEETAGFVWLAGMSRFGLWCGCTMKYGEQGLAGASRFGLWPAVYVEVWWARLGRRKQ
eukprot:scaffold214752_cov19-Tisochrysis_lutea.AAC.1